MILNNAQYGAIQRGYDSKRLKNKRIMKQRQELIYEAIPAIKQIDDEIITTSIEAAKSSLLGDDGALESLKGKSKELAQCKAELLVSNGYTKDFLDPIYTCPICKDTGYIEHNKCQCFKQAVVDLVYSQSEMKQIIRHENFNNFCFDYYAKDIVNDLTGLTPYENILKVVSTAKKYIDNFSHSYQNLLIYGNAGVGKTFLANSIANELLQRVVTVIYLTSYQLFEILEKNKFQKTNEHYKQITNVGDDFIFECDLLIIDDLGTELNNSFITSQLYNCINERHLKKRSTIISTNLSPEELLTSYSERISSRLIGNYTFLNIYGDDIRYMQHTR